MFTLSPFIYYLVYQGEIENYISVVSNGKPVYQLTYSELREIVSEYILYNDQGVDLNHLDGYIMCICDNLVKV